MVIKVGRQVNKENKGKIIKNIKKREGTRKRKIKKRSPGTPSTPDESFVSSQNSS